MSSRSCSSCFGLPQDLADLRRSRAALRAIRRLSDDALAGTQAGRQLRPAFNSNPAEPVLDEVPRRKQTVLIPRTGSRSRPVSLEPRESRRVKQRHSRAQRRRLALRQRNNRRLPRYQHVAHDIDATPALPVGNTTTMAPSAAACPQAARPPPQATSHTRNDGAATRPVGGTSQVSQRSITAYTGKPLARPRQQTALQHRVR
jgi:hypothetical protein